MEAEWLSECSVPILAQGRFDWKVRLLRPDTQARCEILQVRAWRRTSLTLFATAAKLFWAVLLFILASFCPATGAAACCVAARLDAGGVAARLCQFILVPSLSVRFASRFVHSLTQVHARNKPLAADVDLMQVARDLPGLSGAELANVLNEAALEAVRRDSFTIESRDVYNAMDRILQVRRSFP